MKIYYIVNRHFYQALNNVVFLEIDTKIRLKTIFIITYAITSNPPLRITFKKYIFIRVKAIPATYDTIIEAFSSFNLEKSSPN